MSTLFDIDMICIRYDMYTDHLRDLIICFELAIACQLYESNETIFETPMKFGCATRDRPSFVILLPT